MQLSHRNRREMMIAAGALAAAATAASPAFAGQADHAHQHHRGAVVNRPLLTAMYDAVATGQVCIHHCLETLKAGDTSLAACLASVQQMVATCTASGELTALQSPFLKDMLNVALQVCQACETECRKHEQAHAECKASAEACAACITQVQAALAT